MVLSAIVKIYKLYLRADIQPAVNSQLRQHVTEASNGQPAIIDLRYVIVISPN
jgi:hypothetical protein